MRKHDTTLRGWTLYAAGEWLSAVRYVWDPARDAGNQAKHGVSLALAEVLFAGPSNTTTGDRFAYGEVRQLAVGPIGKRVFVCILVDRKVERRVISLRKANKREVRRYGEGFE